MYPVMYLYWDDLYTVNEEQMQGMRMGDLLPGTSWLMQKEG